MQPDSFFSLFSNGPWLIKEKHGFLPLGVTVPGTCTYWGTQLESSSAEMGLSPGGYLTEQDKALTAEKAIDILGCMKKCISSRSREVIHSQLNTGDDTSGILYQSCLDMVLGTLPWVLLLVQGLGQVTKTTLPSPTIPWFYVPELVVKADKLLPRSHILEKWYLWKSSVEPARFSNAQISGSSVDSDGPAEEPIGYFLEILHSELTVKQAEDTQRLCSYLKLICVKLDCNLFCSTAVSSVVSFISFLPSQVNHLLVLVGFLNLLRFLFIFFSLARYLVYLITSSKIRFFPVPLQTNSWRAVCLWLSLSNFLSYKILET